MIRRRSHWSCFEPQRPIIKLSPVVVSLVLRRMRATTAFALPKDWHMLENWNIETASCAPSLSLASSVTWVDWRIVPGQYAKNKSQSLACRVIREIQPQILHTPRRMEGSHCKHGTHVVDPDGVSQTHIIVRQYYLPFKHRFGSVLHTLNASFLSARLQ